MHPERVAALFIAVMVVATAGWLSTRPRELAVPPSTPGFITGRVRDNGGVPARDASVQLFTNAPAWLDGERGCDVSLLACDDLDAGLEVLRRLDEGTLEYPEPLAVTRTDADGRFSLPGVARPDLFVVVNSDECVWDARVDGGLLRLDGCARGGVALLDQLHRPGAPVVFINPFTRAHREVLVTTRNIPRPREVGAHSWATARVDAGASAVLVAASKSLLVLGEAREVAFGVEREVGLGAPDGPVRLECAAHLPRATVTVDGGARFGQVIGGCKVLLGEERFVRPDPSERHVREVTFVPTRLELEVIGADGGEVKLQQYLVFETERRVPLVQGRATIALDESRWLLEVRAHGFLPLSRVVTLDGGLDHLALTPTPAPRLSGLVRDAMGRALSGVRVVASGDAVTTDAAGRFELFLERDEVDVEVRDVRFGALTQHVKDLSAPLVLELRPTRRLSVIAPAAREVRVDQVPLATLDGGVWWFADPPQRLVIEATAPGLAVVRRALDLSGRDEVEVRLDVPTATVLEGTVFSGGNPVAGLTVTVDRDAELPGTDVRTNTRGRFRFEDLEPGPHHLEVQLGERAFAFELTSPALDARVDLPTALGNEGY